MSGTFTIAMAPDGHRVEVKGEVVGCWGVHYDRRDGLYRVTQIKSGLGTGMVTLGWPKELVLKFAKWCDDTYGDRTITEEDGRAMVAAAEKAWKARHP